MVPSKSTVQEITTSLSGDDVLKRAQDFFGRRSPIYNVFPDRQGPNFCSFRGQGTEELVIATAPAEGGTRVTGSTYLFDMQVARFFSTLPVAASTTGNSAATAGAATVNAATSAGA